MAKPKARATRARSFATASASNKSMGHRSRSIAISAAAALEDARRAGLIEGGKTAHASFRALLSLLEAAKRESGVTSLTELGVLALALLVQLDPVAAFFKRTRGRLGETHTLEY